MWVGFRVGGTVPAGIDTSPTAVPEWKKIGSGPTARWHDHRIHWMSPVTPPQVKDTSKRTKIFDWSVPIKVGDQPGAIRGELFWVPNSSSAPTALIVGSIVVAALAVAAVVLLRRRRAAASTGADGAEAPPDREVW